MQPINPIILIWMFGAQTVIFAHKRNEKDTWGLVLMLTAWVLNCVVGLIDIFK